MDKKEYLTIKEFAERVGLSVQAVYKQFNNQLREYSTTVENKKSIHIKALELFLDEEEIKQVEQHFNNDLTTNLNETLSILSEQLKVKDKQIEDLTKILSESQKLNENNQILLKQSQDKVLELESPKEKKSWNIFKK